MKRSTRGRGCLSQAKKDKCGLPSGHHTWNIIISIGRGADNKFKQVWVRFHGTRKEAEQKRTELLGKKDVGRLAEPSKLTVGDWLDQWLETIRPDRALNTVRTYQDNINLHLKPGLGNVLLQKLTALQVERYYAEKQKPTTPGEKPLKAGTVAIHRAILTCALNRAKRHKYIHDNVAMDADNKPKHNKPKHEDDARENVWAADEASKVLTHVKGEKNAQYVALFAVALDSGMRTGELLGLQWQDLEDDGKLHIRRQLLRVSEDAKGFHLHTSPPKGKCARTLDLGQETLTLLREHRRVQAELKMKNRLHFEDHGLVFSQAFEQKSNKNMMLGRPLSRTVIGRQLERLCKAAQVTEITPHGLRHTCATLLLSDNVPVKVVQERLGHKDAAVTMNTYAHVLPGQQADAAKRLGALLHG